MDSVEAILANIESDEEGELNLHGLNLEDILREADDDDDGESSPTICTACSRPTHDNEVRHHPGLAHHHKFVPLEKDRPGALRLEPAEGGVGAEDTERSSEDWAILQEILREAEDEAPDGDLADNGGLHLDVEQIISSFDGSEPTTSSRGTSADQAVSPSAHVPDLPPKRREP
jgi:hypothetical protein